MNYFQIPLLLLTVFLPSIAFCQMNEAYDDFEGNSNISTWTKDNCELDTSFVNPLQDKINNSATVLRYNDIGGQYANIHFDMNDNFDLTTNQTFSLKIYIPSSGVTGNQNNQVSLKLQDGILNSPWKTQCEIIKSVTLDEWQTLTFDFTNDNFKNFDPSSLPPTLRNDFNRVILQVNGENNNDQVLAYIDDILLFETPNNNTVFDKLVWSDEFNKVGAINSKKWFHQTQIPKGKSWFNGEIQHYTNRIDNSYIENGVLKIVAKKETFNDQGVTKNYTSARLNSKFAFTYGKVEIRAKLPSGVGTWPAMWMLGKNNIAKGGYWETKGYATVKWPECGEIDIVEHWGTDQNHVKSAIHTPSSFGKTVNYGGRVVSNVSAEFHDYTMIWTAEKIVFSVDGIPYYTYKPKLQNASTWPFNLEQYLIFNLAILPSIPTSFTESALEIDYIRIYQ